MGFFFPPVVTGNTCEYLISAVLEHGQGLTLISLLFLQLTILGCRIIILEIHPLLPFPLWFPQIHSSMIHTIYLNILKQRRHECLLLCKFQIQMSLWNSGVQYCYFQKLCQINRVQLHYTEFITNYAEVNNLFKFNQPLSTCYHLLY